MIIRAVTAPAHSVPVDVLVYFLSQDEKLLLQQVKEVAHQLRPQLSSIINMKDFKGKECESLSFYPSSGMTSPRVLLIGLGEQKKINADKIRRAAAVAIKKAQSFKVKRVGYLMTVLEGTAETLELSTELLSQTITEGVLLGLYTFNKYKTGNDKPQIIGSLSLITTKKNTLQQIQKGIVTGRIVADATCHARDLSNAPGNEIFPSSLALDAVKTARAHRLRATVLFPKKIRSLNMGGVIAVSSGSIHPPRFIILEHNRAAKKKGTIVLVGKGVTFDSGGISIKASAGMAEMKMDMSGAAAVIGAMQAAADLHLPMYLVGLIPAVENMPSGSALKPGDIITHYNGKTSEVDNTDAEGRLILADALGFASRYKPDLVIDLATLTGACVVALGHHASGMMGNDQPMMDAVKEAGNRAFERVWQLPLFDEYASLIKSDTADVKNAGGRWAGAITAGWFLKNFIGEYPWIHLDIAGTAMLEDPLEYAPRGGSGYGVRLLTEFLRRWKKRSLK
jgi:leucyl aminopeptidase